MLKQRGIDSVTRMNRRKADFRRGKRLGKGDHIVDWPKPTKPRSIDTKEYNLLPDHLAIREIRVHVDQAGFRSKTIIVVTTMLDFELVSKDDLANLFRARWNNETDLKALKQTMRMEILRCKTPELVRKEIWAHILAYNLIRTIIAQAATKHSYRHYVPIAYITLRPRIAGRRPTRTSHERHDSTSTSGVGRRTFTNRTPSLRPGV